MTIEKIVWDTPNAIVSSNRKMVWLKVDYEDLPKYIKETIEGLRKTGYSIFHKEGDFTSGDYIVPII